MPFRRLPGIPFPASSPTGPLPAARLPSSTLRPGGAPRRSHSPARAELAPQRSPDPDRLPQSGACPRRERLRGEEGSFTLSPWPVRATPCEADRAPTRRPPNNQPGIASRPRHEHGPQGLASPRGRATTRSPSPPMPSARARCEPARLRRLAPARIGARETHGLRALPLPAFAPSWPLPFPTAASGLPKASSTALRAASRRNVGPHSARERNGEESVIRGRATAPRVSALAGVLTSANSLRDFGASSLP